MGVIGILVAVAAAVAGHEVSSSRHAVTAGGGVSISLEVSDTKTRPGESVGLMIVNNTSRKVRYGLATRVQRDHSGRWVSATKAVYGTKHPGVRLIALFAPPHGQGGPGPVGAGLYDEIVLPKDLRPGRYRALKEVTVVGNGERTLRATFRVSR